MKPINRVRLKKITKYVIIVLLILTVIFAAFTIYGSQVGNFVVNIEKERNINLALFNNAELTGGTAQLFFPGLTDQTHATYPQHIPDDVEDGMGDKNDYTNRRYIAFSFVIKNTSAVDVDIQMELTIEKVTQNVDAAARVMIIVDGQRSIYAKAKDYPLDQIGQPEDYPYLTIPFAAPMTICRQEFLNVKSGASLKFTIVSWLEGEDAQCTDDIKGGTMKMEMSFAGR